MTETQPTLPSAGPYRTSALHPPLEDGRLIVPFEGQTAMRLSIGAGLSHAHIHVHPDAEDLICVDPGEGPSPRLRTARSELRLTWPLSLVEWLRVVVDGRRDELVIVLHPSVEWTLALGGGLSHVSADLREGRVARVDVRGGVSDVELTLPPPPETGGRVRIAGGASHLRLHRPADVSVGVAVTGGVSRLRVDERRYDAIGGGSRIESGGGPSCWEVDVSGGASEIEVDRS
ncbi:MAG: hypothetical protein KC619_15455 [Myxococcales bacterium]|nr:hypothetical protein [Myxococcales bacterium]